MKTLSFILILILFVISVSFGESAPAIEIDVRMNGLRLSDDTFSLTPSTRGKLGYKSQGNKNVKAELSLSAAVIGSDVQLNLYRSFIKVRFPGFRALVGNTHLSWGEGTYFNAGDVIYGSTDLGANTMSDVIRDDNAWLASIYVPLGPFSFLEAVVLPPPVEIAIAVINSEIQMVPSIPLISMTRLGGRLVTKLAGIKVEGGYLYQDEIHRPYISLQGNLLLDYHVSAGVTIPSTVEVWEDIDDSLQISCGLFHMQGLGNLADLTFRLEGLVTPYGLWGETDNPDSNYGLYLYPEMNMAIDQTVNVLLSGLVSPLDGSAQITAGWFWNIYQGFRIMNFVVARVGDENDTWGRTGDIAVVAGLRFVY